MPELIGDVLRCILAVFDKQTRIAEREALIEDYEIEQYERHAAGGRVRAGGARRNDDGTFAPNCKRAAHQ